MEEVMLFRDEEKIKQINSLLDKFGKDVVKDVIDKRLNKYINSLSIDKIKENSFLLRRTIKTPEYYAIEPDDSEDMIRAKYKTMLLQYDGWHKYDPEKIINSLKNIIKVLSKTDFSQPQDIENLIDALMDF